MNSRVHSGGLYGKISVDALDKVRPEIRNPILANMLELLRITENRYSGIPTMRTECLKAGLPAPVFSAIRGEFKVTMRNGYYGYGDDIVAESVVDFCQIPRSRAEIISFTGKSRNYVMGQIVAPLVDSGKLRMTLPEKPKSSLQKFIKNESESFV